MDTRAETTIRDVTVDSLIANLRTVQPRLLKERQSDLPLIILRSPHACSYATVVSQHIFSAPSEVLASHIPNG